MRSFYTLADLSDARLDSCKLGVIGNPIAHSKSPQMQQAALNGLGIRCTYIRLQADLGEGGFENLLQRLCELEFIGANVTVPFKKQAFGSACKADALSTLCGASNTLVRHGNGWHAFNTDGPGFERAILELGGKPLHSLNVAIIGACGGAGSALAAQCALAGCPSLALINRPKPALAELAAKLAPHSASNIATCHFGTPEMRQAIAAADLVVNATSLGLREGDPLPLPPEWLRPGQMAYDIVTRNTPLLHAANERGCIAGNGLAMLLWQGAYAFEHWFGSLPDIEPMRLALSKA